MSTSNTTQANELPTFTNRLQTVISGAGLISIVAGGLLIEGWLPVAITVGTVLVWWRTSTPLALITLTVGLTVAVPSVVPPAQFGASMMTVSSIGISIVILASGIGLLTIGSWLTLETTPPLAGGWMLLPLAVGWLCVGGAAVAGVALWVVLAVCGGLTLLGANAITQFTEYRLTTGSETATRPHEE